jgi:predicted DNA-binding transcriptional regulator AlpA
MGRRHLSFGPTPAILPARLAVRPTPRRESPAATLAATMRSKTVRATEIAELLGVSHQRTSVTVRQRGFPKPIGREGQSRLWDRREVMAWAKRWRREKPRRSTAVSVPKPLPSIGGKRLGTDGRI